MNLRRFVQTSAYLVVLVSIVGYVAIVVFMVLQEDRLVYPERSRTDLTAAVPGAGATFPWDSLRTVAEDGAAVFLIRSRSADGAGGPWALYFHGQTLPAGAPVNVARLRFLRDAGFNVAAVEYRGYGASSAAGPPSEAGIYADARAAWRYLTSSMSVAPERILLYGWSMGAGPAVKLATEVPAGALVTEGAYTSAPDIAAESYPWLPVRLLMRNRYPNRSRASAVSMPWLLLHGRADRHISPHHAEALAAAAPTGQLVWLDAGHEGGVLEDRQTALAALRDHARPLFESGSAASTRARLQLSTGG